jgi:hypothetical protein
MKIVEGRRFVFGKRRFARQGDNREKNNRPRQACPSIKMQFST